CLSLLLLLNCFQLLINIFMLNVYLKELLIFIISSFFFVLPQFRHRKNLECLLIVANYKHIVGCNCFSNQ
ncbi:MAG: hypothetical protein N4R15_05145, partial [Lactobacillus iners]|nr:hypothetical protein [Lactobacillus iners]